MKTALAAASTVVCWAYSPIGIRMALQSYEPGQLALLRFLIASAFMMAIALVARISLPRVKDYPMLLALGVFAVTLHHLALNAGQRYVSAGTASVLAQSTPIFTAVIAHFFLRERVTVWRWACVLLGMVGVFVVIAGENDLETVNVKGLLILLAALSWSIYFVLQKRCSQRYDALTMVCYTVWTGTALLCVYLPGLGHQLADSSARSNVAIVVLGIFPSALAYLWWSYVLARMEVSRASVFLYLIPPVAMLFASMMLGEKTPFLVMAGGGIVIGSVIAMNMERKAGSPVAIGTMKNFGKHYGTRT